MRLVLDTNIVISALLWRGNPYRLLQLGVAGEFELLTSPVLIVSGDKHLLGLSGQYSGIPIVRAIDAVRMLEIS